MIEALVAEAGRTLDELSVVGISAPGPLSAKSGTLLNAPNMTGWDEVPIVDMFRTFLPGPIVINNDANAAALAEWTFGKYKGVDGLVYLTMSTGLGAGIIVNGGLLQGCTDTAGEVGYHVLDLMGPISPCGHRGSYEAFCGGKNMADQLRQRIKDESIQTAILDYAGGDYDKIDFKCLLEAVRSGDVFANSVWQEYTLRLAQGIGNLIMILNPQAVLLGTIGLHAGETLLQPLRELLPRFVLKPPLDACTIAPATLGSAIGDLAAIALAVQELDAKKGR